MIVGYLIFSIRLKCCLRQEFNSSSSVLVNAQVPELYTRTGLTKDFYNLILKVCFISAFSHPDAL